MARSIRSLAGAGLGLCLALSACSSGSSGGSAASGKPANCPVKVAAVAPLTGSSASYGNTEKIGYDLAVSDINASSAKVLGCNVEISYIDDASDPSKIPGLITQALSSKKYDYVTQFAVGTPVALQFFATQHKLSIGSDGEEAYNDPAKYPLWFDMAGSLDEGSRQIAKSVASAGYKRIALVQSTIGNLGGADEKNMSAALKGTPAKLVTTQSVDFAVTDASGVALKVKQSNPDAVIADLYGPALGVVLKALDAQGVTAQRFGAYYAAAANPSATAAPKDIATMVVMTYKASVAGVVDGMDAFAAKVAAKAAGGKLPVPVTAASFGHDALMAWAAAANAVKGFDDQKLANWLAANGQTAIPGLVSFDGHVTGYSDQNHLAVAGYTLAKANSLSQDGLYQPATMPTKG